MTADETGKAATHEDTPAHKTEEHKHMTKAEAKKAAASERTENIVALVVFGILLLVVVGIFTKGFGLFAGEAVVRMNVPVGDSHATGATNPKVIIIAFSDYECPYCAKAEATMKNIRSYYPDDVVYVFRNFPLTSIHPDAMGAALAAECANDQNKFWEYHDYLYAHNTALGKENLKQYAVELGLNSASFNQCLDSERYASRIKNDMKDAWAAKVTSTPTFFINGRLVLGSKPETEFIKIINEEIELAK